MSRPLHALLGLTLLAACAEAPPPAPPPPPRVAARVFAVDLEGRARACTETAPAEPAAGSPAAGQMALFNDGGWCGLPVNQAGPKPFAAGLLVKRPQHGTVTIHSVGDVTRLDYMPDPGFGGPDSFTVRLIPGNAEVAVAVTVEGPPPPPPPPPAPTPAPRQQRRPG